MERIFGFLKKNVLHIHCGVEGDHQAVPKNSHHCFLAVAQVIPIPFELHLPTAGSFSFLFTSKNAVQIFQDRYLTQCQNQHTTQLIEKIGAVGPHTGKLLATLFPKTPLCYPAQLYGLKSLLEMDHAFSKNSTLFIFTSLMGKSSEIIDQFQRKNEFKFVLAPLYKIAFLDADVSSLFEKQHDAYVFYYKSENIFKQIKKLLCSFYHVSSIDSLPDFVSFRPWENLLGNQNGQH